MKYGTWTSIKIMWRYGLELMEICYTKMYLLFWYYKFTPCLLKLSSKYQEDSPDKIIPGYIGHISKEPVVTGIWSPKHVEKNFTKNNKHTIHSRCYCQLHNKKKKKNFRSLLLCLHAVQSNGKSRANSIRNINKLPQWEALDS